jgi:multisubunit Na+/H+ antiporter MnhE subunit
MVMIDAKASYGIVLSGYFAYCARVVLRRKHLIVATWRDAVLLPKSLFALVKSTLSVERALLRQSLHFWRRLPDLSPPSNFETGFSV